jgi:hypothetical protein
MVAHGERPGKADDLPTLLSIDDQRHALFSEHNTRANEGCDFDFLVAPGRNPEPDPK